MSFGIRECCECIHPSTDYFWIGVVIGICALFIGLCAAWIYKKGGFDFEMEDEQ